MEKSLTAVRRNCVQEKNAELFKGVNFEETVDSVPVFFCDFRSDFGRWSRHGSGYSEGVYGKT